MPDPGQSWPSGSRNWRASGLTSAAGAPVAEGSGCACNAEPPLGRPRAGAALQDWPRWSRPVDAAGQLRVAQMMRDRGAGHPNPGPERLVLGEQADKFSPMIPPPISARPLFKSDRQTLAGRARGGLRDCHPATELARGSRNRGRGREQRSRSDPLCKRPLPSFPEAELLGNRRQCRPARVRPTL